MGRRGKRAREQGEQTMAEWNGGDAACQTILIRTRWSTKVIS